MCESSAVAGPAEPAPSPLRGTGTIAVNHPSLEQFLSACGSPEPLRVGVGQRDQLLSETWTFRQPFLVIGRRPDSDLMLDHWQVSRRHAYLQLIEGRYLLRRPREPDRDPRGGRVRAVGWLERGPGDPDRPVRGPPGMARAGPPRGPGPLPGVTWELPGRAIGQAVWRMDRQLVLVGRSPACRIRIVEPDVSKFHCSLVLTPMGVWAVDLLGQNGIFVNDEPVRFARLEDGDELRVGRHSLRPRYDARRRPWPGPAGPADGRPAGELATIAPVPGPIRPATWPPGCWPARPALAVDGQEIAGFGERPGGDRRPDRQPAGPAVRPDAAADVRPVPSDHDDDVRGVRRAPPRAGGRRSARSSSRSASSARRSRRSGPRRPGSPRRPGAGRRAAPARTAGRANGHAGPGPAAGRIPPADPIRRPTPPPPDPEVDIHAQLCLRLASIQTERQNRWQKILGMMSSRS